MNNFEKHFNEWITLGRLKGFNMSHKARLHFFPKDFKTWLKKPDARAVEDNRELEKWTKQYIIKTEKELSLPF